MTWQPMARPRGVLAVYNIEEGSTPLLRLDRKNPPDLDELVMWLSTVDEYGEPGDPYWLFDALTEKGWGDTLTKVRGYPYRNPEARVGWLRINPCACGGEHAWDFAWNPSDASEEPHKPGVFLGVEPW